MVCTTLSLRLSMTDTLLSAVLVTNTAPLVAYTAVGCRPTSMVPTAASGYPLLEELGEGSVTSMTLTVPVVLAPVCGLATTWVP